MPAIWSPFVVIISVRAIVIMAFVIRSLVVVRASVIPIIWFVVFKFEVLISVGALIVIGAIIIMLFVISAVAVIIIIM